MSELRATPWWKSVLQIRLRTLMIAVLLACVGLSWFGIERRRISQQQRHLDELEDLGVRYFTKPYSSGWLQYFMGKSYVKVVGLDFSFANPINSDLKKISNFHDVERLSLHQCEHIDDAGLAHLKNLTKLESLSLHGTKVTGTGLHHLSKCENLGVLSFQSAPLLAKHANELVQFERLRILNLQNIAGGGPIEIHNLPELKLLSFLYCRKIPHIHLHDLPKLESLNLKNMLPPNDLILERVGTLDSLDFPVSYYDKVKPNVVLRDMPDLSQVKITFAESLSTQNTPRLNRLVVRVKQPMDLEELQSLTALDYVLLTGVPGLEIPISHWPKLASLTTDGIIHFKSLPKVTRNLSGDGSLLTDDDLVSIREHPTLRFVTLRPCPNLTDKSLEHFGTLPCLTHLSIATAKLTDDGLKQIASCPLEEVSFFGNPGITGMGFEALLNCPNLKRVSVHNCSISTEGEAMIRSLPSLKHLQMGNINAAP